MKPVKILSQEATKHICPVIRDFFVQVYEHPENYIDPEQQKDTHSSLIKFQLALKKIPNWTNTQIKKQIDEIAKRCPWFKQLLIGLFVAYINAISNGIRTSSRSKRLKLNLPSDETFVHTCFVTCANNLYEDPFIMKDDNEKRRDKELDTRLTECIMESIYKLIPMRDILNEHIPISDGMVSLGDDDVLPEPEETSEPVPTTSAEEIPSEEPKTTEEPKTIPVKPDLFPDAPDEKVLMSDDEEETKIPK